MSTESKATPDEDVMKRSAVPQILGFFERVIGSISVSKGAELSVKSEERAYISH